MDSPRQLPTRRHAPSTRYPADGDHRVRPGRTSHGDRRPVIAARSRCTSLLRSRYSEGWVRFLLLSDDPRHAVATVAGHPIHRRMPCDRPSGRARPRPSRGRPSTPATPSPEYFKKLVGSSTAILVISEDSSVLDPRDLAPEAFQARARALGAHDLSIRRLISAVVGRGIHDPAVWGRDFQVPRRLRDAIRDPLPRLALERSVTSPVDGFQKLLFRTARRPGGRDGPDPAAQAGGGERLPLVAGRLRDGLRLLRDGADAAAAQPGDLGDHRPVRPGARAGRSRRAGG